MPQQQRAELERLSLATLQKLAAKVGVEQSDIFDAIDTRLPKDTLVGLILDAENPTSAQSRQHRAEQHRRLQEEQSREEEEREQIARAVESAAEGAASFQHGQHVVYFDLDARGWVPGVVQRVSRSDNYSVELQVAGYKKLAVDAMRVRKLTQLETADVKEQQLVFKIGERAQFFNAPHSDDWIEAVITDFTTNKFGRVNSCSVNVLLSKHFPVADQLMERVRPEQVRPLTAARIREERERRERRWEAALRSDAEPPAADDGDVPADEPQMPSDSEEEEEDEDAAEAVRTPARGNTSGEVSAERSAVFGSPASPSGAVDLRKMPMPRSQRRAEAARRRV